MRVIVQRVESAKVEVDSKVVGRIDQGYLLYVGIHVEDDEQKVIKMAEKVHNLRVFEDDEQKMNLPLANKNGSILAISQFTLYGDTKGNNRPSFIQAARPDQAEKLYLLFVNELKKHHHVEQGVFQAHMKVHSINDGPVTILIEF
ncbi:D-aminoacyl-tRNA deacylase [Peloplasma aerotolerans]|jgi:D-aminoacyl-tRNA deacylase|uniref:D-aminoacyl-tRNA deacylase n=1 Tax=Peloplasma aerotolerans TaxID=3044389 RepID=A0AAW6U2C7_9MOLU|nr:D-aminoacyl-tRNA deacylase [Mariniplasma sp. M4Ah]MDI6452040.1 D-aminoacyl-tRNA deacylase [Mariniplasma sp. M4Ah]